MILYNFVQYLKNELPIERIYTETRIKITGQEFIPDRNILVRSTGGITPADFGLIEETFQVIVRDKDNVSASKLAEQIFNLFFENGTFGLILPQAIVGGDTFPEIQIEQINPIQRPYNMGFDEDSRIEYSTNYILKYR